MNEDIKQNWISALRSGKYIQGKERLRNTNETYCCLGVLCEVIGIEHSFHSGYKCKLQDREVEFTSRIPTEISKNYKIGIGFDVINYLTYLNDSENKDFNEIADYIEEYL